MAPESITQDRIYHAVKGDYATGLYQPGARMELQAIADRHRASTTPVREALHRLIGERLVEPHPDGGFRIVVADASRLAQLYSWYAQQILATLHLLRETALARALAPFRGSLPAAGPLCVVERTDRIFLELAGATGNRELSEQIEAANQRLRYPRLAEVELFHNHRRELETLTRNGHLGGIANVRRRMTAYHDRRVLHAAEIASAVQARAERPGTA